jgi:hypothetical protein
LVHLSTQGYSGDQNVLHSVVFVGGGGCPIVLSGSWAPTYRKHVFPACTFLHFYPEDGDSMFLQEGGTHLPAYTVSYLRSPKMVNR